MIEKILLSPIFLTKMLAMKHGIYTKVGTLSASAVITDEPIKREDWANLDFKPFPKGKRWTDKKFACAVFRLKGVVPEKAKGKQTVALLKFGSEGEVYDKDGKAICGITPIMSTIDVGQPLLGKQVVPLFDSPEGGEEINLDVDCGHNGYCGMFLYNPRLVKADIAVVDQEKKDFYYDCLSLLLTLSTRGGNKYLTDDGIKEIKNAFSQAYGLYKKDEIAKARAVLKPFFEEKNEKGVEYTAIGHGHLDLAWKWPLREGRRKAVRTFSNVVNYQEKYDFTFGASQAQMFKWVEEDQPELFERIKENVKQGKIEIQGGMWTECDCNLPCGESLIRQFLYGEKYFMEKFGQSSDVAWLPDVFGFPHTLPQIIKGVGKKYFMTIKLNWNEVNKFPLQTFYWTAPDGSQVLSHIPPEGTYHTSASPVPFALSDVKNRQKETGSALLIYGVSDGGGGPGEGHLEMVKRAGGKYHPKAKQGKSISVFEKLAEIEHLPKHDGELYLEKHRGTLTSQSKNKYYNRLSERKLHNLEWLESVTGKKYENRDEVWQKVLTNQFHDILPGSGIERVHTESVQTYIEVCEELDKEINERIAMLSKGKKLTALNPAPFARKDIFEYNQELYQVECLPYSSAKPIRINGLQDMNYGTDYIENSLIKVSFDTKTGEIISVYDKQNGKEYAKKSSFHNLVMHDDPKGRFDAWDIDKKYLEMNKEKLTLVKISFSRAKSKVSALLHYIYNESKITQEVYITDTKTIYFDTQTDWKETHKMMRAEFLPSVWSDKANFDIQFGSINRSTKTETKQEKAMFEVCGHNYGAVGDEESGYLAVMSTGKFGYRAQDGIFSLNLLRSPAFPDKNCDKGEQKFLYAVTFTDSMQDVVKQGYLLNNPIILTEEDVDINLDFNLTADVIIENIKPAEDTDGVVIRAYERHGNTTSGDFIYPVGYTVYETDMLERVISQGDRVTFNPHEIKTFLFTKQKENKE